MSSKDLSSRYLGPYRIEKSLGVGGMGEVYQAHDDRLGRRVAVKRVLKEKASAKARARFRSEARAVASLSHPSIVQIFDVLEEDDGDWIVMELVDGPTVADLIQDGPLDLRRIITIGHEVADGLAEAHEEGLVHRDLKTQNVALTSKDSLRNRPEDTPWDPRPICFPSAPCSTNRSPPNRPFWSVENSPPSTGLSVFRHLPSARWRPIFLPHCPVWWTTCSKNSPRPVLAARAWSPPSWPHWPMPCAIGPICPTSKTPPTGRRSTTWPPRRRQRRACPRGRSV